MPMAAAAFLAGISWTTYNSWSFVSSTATLFQPTIFLHRGCLKSLMFLALAVSAHSEERLSLERVGATYLYLLMRMLDMFRLYEQRERLGLL